MEQKYFKVSEVAQIFGMTPKQVRGYCHNDDATIAKFAFQPVKNGNILIDIKKFENYIKMGLLESKRRITK